MKDFSAESIYNVTEIPADAKRVISDVYITEIETKAKYTIGFERKTCVPAGAALFLHARAYEQLEDGKRVKMTKRQQMPSKTMVSHAIKRLYREHKVKIFDAVVNAKARAGLVPILIKNDSDHDKYFMPGVPIGKLKVANDRDTWDNHVEDLVQAHASFINQLGLAKKANNVDVPFNSDGKDFKVPDDCLALKLLEQQFIEEKKDIDYDFMGVINTIKLPEKLDVREAADLLRIVYNNRACFARSEYDIGLAKGWEFPILTGEHPPISEKPRRLHPKARDFCFENIDELLAKGIIQISNSPWSAPITVVPKPRSDKLRMCLDFRRLNSITVTNCYPLQRIDEITDALGKAKKFSVVDILSGYYNVPIRAEDVPKTAFSCSGKGLYEWLRLPFGLKNAPSYFVQMMDVTLADLLFNICLCYIDDIIIYSNTFDEHIERLDIVFNRLIKTGLKLRLDKCKFFQDEILFLGHIISENGFKPSDDKVEAVKLFPVPGNTTDLRSFLGLTGYYRRFIKDFAKIAHPLHALLKKDAEYKWTDQCQLAYEILKEKLITAPVLAFPDLSSEGGQFNLFTDASLLGVGAVLEQIQPDGKTSRPVAFVNRGLTPAEKNMSITELECLAVHYAMRKLRPYLLTAEKKFLLTTDHQSLTWLFKNGLSHLGGSRLVRWVIELQEYNFVVVHRPGKAQTHCDALSRAFPTIEKGKNFGDCTASELNAFYYGWVYATETRAMKARKRDNESGPHEPGLQDQQEPNIESGSRLRISSEISNEPSDELDNEPNNESNEPNYEPIELDDDLENPENQDQNVKIKPKAISETPNIGHDTEEDLQVKDKLIQAMLKDKFSAAIMNYINKKILPDDDEKLKDYILSTTDQYFIDDGLLFHFYISPLGIKKPRAFKRLYLPFEFRDQVLMAMHDGVMAGHYGEVATFEKVARLYFWKSMAQDVHIYVKTCDICQKVNKGRAHKRFKLVSIEIPTEPLELVSMDILYINEVGTKYYGNKYLLVIIDHKTRYLKVIPMRNEKASTVARLFIEHFVCNFGIPARLISDNGTNFLSTTCQELYRMLGIHKSRTTIYYPSSDLVEISNRSILRMLRKFSHQNHGEWDRYIHLLTYAYNATVHSSTSETPFYLMFGRTPPIPACYSKVDFEPIRAEAEYPANLARKMKDIWATAGYNNQKALEVIKQQHDRHAGDLEEIKPDDTVLLDGSVLKSQAVREGKVKLELPWSKFAKCVSVNDKNNTIVVIDEDGNVNNLNRQHVKKYHERKPKQSEIPDTAILSYLKKIESINFFDEPAWLLPWNATVLEGT